LPIAAGGSRKVYKLVASLLFSQTPLSAFCGRAVFFYDLHDVFSASIEQFTM
jgi:hypothetical protein